MRLYGRSCNRSLLAAALAIAASNANAVSYSFEQILDVPTGITEYRLRSDGFHFGSLLQDPVGRLVFRPHPDRLDPNGWGSSWYMAPFFAGTDSRGGRVDSIAVGAGGIAVSLSGVVPLSATQTFGTWSYSGTFAYEEGPQRATASGQLGVALDGQVSVDLNLNRIASNFLAGVPFQGGGSGNTGDMSGALVTYAPGSDPRNFAWMPPDLPAHFPTDASGYLGIDVLGELNRVDTLALGETFQITVARKPSLALAYEVVSGGSLSAGLFWNAAQGQNFALDNIGINHLRLWQNALSSSAQYNVTMSSVAAVPEAHAWVLLLAGLIVVGGACRAKAREVVPGRESVLV